MFMHACVNITSKRIKASSRKTNPWKNTLHERIMRRKGVNTFTFVILNTKSYFFLRTMNNHLLKKGNT